MSFSIENRLTVKCYRIEMLFHSLNPAGLSLENGNTYNCIYNELFITKRKSIDVVQHVML